MSNPREQVPLLLAGHPALDFLNTVAAVDGVPVDSLQRDEDVSNWLAHALPPSAPLPVKIPALLRPARLLRESLRAAIERIKAGKKPSLTALNDSLAKSTSHLQLASLRDGTVQSRRTWPNRTPGQILGPLAEAAADLLVSADFHLVRQCEDPACILWFYDRTKSRHRRWCSPATCGNRNKVAAFRRRQHAEP